MPFLKRDAGVVEEEDVVDVVPPVEEGADAVGTVGVAGSSAIVWSNAALLMEVH